MDLKRVIEEYLQQSKFMQIATVNDTHPWICTVNYAVDKELQLYWMSARTRRHSQELHTNPHVAISVVVDTEKRIGIQLTGVAQEVSPENLTTAHAVYSERYGDNDERLTEAQSADLTARAYYIFKPEYMVLFDGTKPVENQRQEYKI